MMRLNMVYRVTKCWQVWILRSEADPLYGIDYHADREELVRTATAYVEAHGGELIIENEAGEEVQRLTFAFGEKT